MNALKKMNPGVEFKLDTSGNVLSTSADPSTLNLPKGYEFNAKNGITNKHHTTSGIYNTLATRQDPSLATGSAGK